MRGGVEEREEDSYTPEVAKLSAGIFSACEPRAYRLSPSRPAIADPYPFIPHQITHPSTAVGHHTLVFDPYRLSVLCASASCAACLPLRPSETSKSFHTLSFTTSPPQPLLQLSSDGNGSIWGEAEGLQVLNSPASVFLSRSPLQHCLADPRIRDDSFVLWRGLYREPTVVPREWQPHDQWEKYLIP